MADIISEVSTATINPFVNLWHGFLNTIPGIIGAIFILVVGFIIGYFLGSLVKHALRKVGLDKWIEKKGLSKSILNIKLSNLVGQIVKWSIFIWFLVPAAELMNIGGFSELMTSFALWVPNLIIAILILIIGLIIAKLVTKEIGIENKTTAIIGKIVQIILIIIFANIALNQIGVPTRLIENIIIISIAAVLIVFAIIIGISFGNAGKKHADKLVDEYMTKRKKEKK